MASNRDPILDHLTPPKPQSTHSAPQSSVGPASGPPTRTPPSRPGESRGVFPRFHVAPPPKIALCESLRVSIRGPSLPSLICHLVSPVPSRNPQT